jgi:hypothetical protein
LGAWLEAGAACFAGVTDGAGAGSGAAGVSIAVGGDGEAGSAGIGAGFSAIGAAGGATAGVTTVSATCGVGGVAAGAGAGARASASSVFREAPGSGGSIHKTRKPKSVRPTTPNKKFLIGNPFETEGAGCTQFCSKTVTVGKCKAKRNKAARLQLT